MLTSTKNKVTYYDKYGGNNKNLVVFNINNKYVVCLTNFKFNYNDIEYSINFDNNGSYGQFYQIIIDNNNYITNNVWCMKTEAINPINGILIPIDNNNNNNNNNNNTTNNLILLDNPKYCSNCDLIIQYYVNKTNKIIAKEKYQDMKQAKFWFSKKLLVSIVDKDKENYLYIMVETINNDEDQIYYLLKSHDIIMRLINVIDNHIIYITTSFDEIIIKFISLLNTNYKNSQVNVIVGSEKIYKKLNKKFYIENQIQSYLNMPFINEVGYKFILYIYQ